MMRKNSKNYIILVLCLIVFFAVCSSGFPEKNTILTVAKNPKEALKGIVICIDPGHQKVQDLKNEPIAPGSKVLKEKTSSGTAGIATKIPEYKLNLNVSLKLKSALEKQGAKVVMTRESNDVDIGNIQRANIANNTNAQLCIRIHADGSDNTAVNGISILTPGNKYIKDKTLLIQSHIAAKFILDAVIATTKAKSRGLVERNDLTGFNWSKVPVILIEMGFMTNQQEDRKLNSSEYEEKIVNGMTQGINNYFKKVAV